jgi:hypothetical protein
MTLGLVVHTCRPSNLGRWRKEAHKFETREGNLAGASVQSMHETLGPIPSTGGKKKESQWRRVPTPTPRNESTDENTEATPVIQLLGRLRAGGCSLSPTQANNS